MTAWYDRARRGELPPKSLDDRREDIADRVGRPWTLADLLTTEAPCRLAVRDVDRLEGPEREERE